MGEKTHELWVLIGERLVHGEKHYGGFNFEKYDLDQMALEEILDFIVYRAAQRYIKEKDNGSAQKSSGNT